MGIIQLWLLYPVGVLERNKKMAKCSNPHCKCINCKCGDNCTCTEDKCNCPPECNEQNEE